MKNDKKHATEKKAMHHPRWDKRVIQSLGDEECVDPKELLVAEFQEENDICEWSHIQDESEWSLMISLIRRLGFP